MISDEDTDRISKEILRQNIEKSLLRRKTPEQKSWEREMVLGSIHSFDEYQLPITNSDGHETIVVIKEDAAMIATRVWDCAVLTTKWIEHMSLKESDIPDIGKALNLKLEVTKRPIHVLELGSGTGLLSICLAKMGAAVLSTEYGPVVKFLEKNCEYNDVLPASTETITLVAGMSRCRELDWFKEAESLEKMFMPSEDPVFDLVIVTDCSLTPQDSEGVFQMIRKYSTPGHTRVVVGSCFEREGTPVAIQHAKRFDNFMQISPSDFHPDFSSSRFTIMTFDA